jgi:hypothetical protein
MFESLDDGNDLCGYPAYCFHYALKLVQGMHGGNMARHDPKLGMYYGSRALEKF